MLRWIGGATVALRDPDLVASHSPVRIRAHAIGPGIPARDLLVSPQHRIMISQTDTALLFVESEVFCAPAHLVNGVTITREPAPSVTYFHLLFDTHQIVGCHRCFTESFLSGHG